MDICPIAWRSENNNVNNDGVWKIKPWGSYFLDSILKYPSWNSCHRNRRFFFVGKCHTRTLNRDVQLFFCTFGVMKISQLTNKSEWKHHTDLSERSAEKCRLTIPGILVCTKSLQWQSKGTRHNWCPAFVMRGWPDVTFVVCGQLCCSFTSLIRLKLSHWAHGLDKICSIRDIEVTKRKSVFTTLTRQKFHPELRVPLSTSKIHSLIFPKFVLWSFFWRPVWIIHCVWPQEVVMSP